MILIVVLALARKFIVLDIRETTPAYRLALAAVTAALGLTYWLMTERDDPKLDVSRDHRFPRSPGSSVSG